MIFADTDPAQLEDRWLHAPQQLPQRLGDHRRLNQSSRVTVEVRFPGANAVRIHLTRGKTDRPARGLNVVLEHPVAETTFIRRTSDRGIVEYRDVPPGRYRVYAMQGSATSGQTDEERELYWHHGAQAEFALDLNEIVIEPGGAQTFELSLRIAEISGVVLDGDGRPLQGAIVYPTLHRSDHGITLSAGGHFRFQRLLYEVSFVIRVSYEGEDRMFRFKNPAHDGTSRDITVVWAEPELDTFNVEVVDVFSDEPIRDASVSMYFIGEGPYFRGFGRSDEDGWARIHHAPLGLYNFQVSHTDYHAMIDERARIEDRTLRVMLEPLGRVLWQLRGFNADAPTSASFRAEVEDLANAELSRTYQLALARQELAKGLPVPLRIGRHYRITVTIHGFEPFTFEVIAQHPDEASKHAIQLRRPE